MFTFKDVLPKELNKAKEVHLFTAEVLPLSLVQTNESPIQLNVDGCRMFLEQEKATLNAVSEEIAKITDVNLNEISSLLEDKVICVVDIAVDIDRSASVYMVDGEESDPQYNPETSQLTITLKDRVKKMSLVDYKVEDIEVEFNENIGAVVVTKLKLFNLENPESV